MPVMVVVGGQFGDEGKGKIVSYLGLRDHFTAAVRAGVGPNAGHTVVSSGKTLRLRLLPSAVVNEKVRLMIGAGVLVNPSVLLSEISETGCESRVLVDAQCAIIEDSHIELDKSAHLKEKIGTTGTGTGPANADRVMRRVKVARDVPSLSKYIGDIYYEVHKILDAGEHVLAEGTQGTFLSLYHGTYPYVTSKDVSASAVCSDIGIGPREVTDVVVVFKSYVTRVGEGPLDGELSQEEAAKRGWREVATVTGRVRRAAPFDFEKARKAARLNGATQIALTKLDILYPSCKGAKEMSTLPVEAKKFIEDVESSTGAPVSLIGTGPDAQDIIDRRG